jgi:hypothetical protein
MESHRVSRPIHGEPTEIGLVVGVIEEHRLPPIAADHDVVEEPRTEDPWRSSHVVIAELVPGLKVARENVKVKA